MEELTVLEKIDKLAAELKRLRSMVVHVADPVSTITLTRDDFFPNADALVAVMPSIAVTEYGIADMYKDKKMAQLKDMRVFAAKSSDDTPILCIGPGIYVNDDKTYIEPMWGFAGIYPHLIASGHAFFNGHLPLSPPDTYVELLFKMARKSAGRAIVTLYPQPWSPFLETALLVYLISTGSQHVYAVGPQYLKDDAAKCLDIKSYQNINGTYCGAASPRDRRIEVATITELLLRDYSNAVKSPRFLHNFHASPGPDANVWSLRDDLARHAKKQDQFDTLANVITPKMFDSAGLISQKTREAWYASNFAMCYTDIGVLLGSIFRLGLLTSSQVPDTRALKLAQSAAAATVTSFLRLPSKPEHKDIYPVILFLNVLMPENLKTLIL